MGTLYAWSARPGTRKSDFVKGNLVLVGWSGFVPLAERYSSRSDVMTVAVGFNPRNTSCPTFLLRRVATADVLSVVADHAAHGARTSELGGDVLRGLKPTATIGGRYATKFAQTPAFLGSVIGTGMGWTA